MKLILASNSPRRRELLAGMDLEFSVDTGNNFEETLPEGVPAEEVPLLLSRGKSLGFHRPLEEGEVLLSADTVVIVDSCVLGKPHSASEAATMLRRLSGREHQVVSAVTLRDSGRTLSFSDSATVCFNTLSEGEIDYYIEHYRPFDKAGAYGIQEWIGYIGISGISGSFFTVMGLPVHKVWSALKSFGELPLK